MDNIELAKMSIKDLRTELKALKSEMESKGVGTAEFKALAEQVNTVDGALKSATNSVKNLNQSEFSKVAAAGQTIAAGFTAAQGALNLFGVQSQEVTKAIQKMQALQGLTQSLGQLKGAFKSGGEAAKQFKGALDVLKAHPIIAVLAVVVVTLTKIINAIKQNEAAVYRLKEAFAPLNGVVNVFKNALEVITNLVADLAVKLAGPLTQGIQTVIKWIAKGAEALGMDGIAGALNQIEETSKAEQQIAKENLELQKERRRVAAENADIQVKITELETQFVKATGDVNKQKKISAEIEAEQLKIKQNNYDLAKREYEQIVKINAQTQSGQKDLDAENQAYVNMMNAKAEFNRISKESTRLARQEGKENAKNATDAAKAYEDMKKKKDEELAAEAEYAKLTIEDADELARKLIDIEKKKLDYYQEGSKEYYQVQNSIRAAEKKLNEDSLKNAESRVKAEGELEIKGKRQVQKELIQIEKDKLKLYKEDSLEYVQIQANVAKMERQLSEDLNQDKLDDLETKHNEELTALQTMLYNKEISLREFNQSAKTLNEEYKQDYVQMLQEMLAETNLSEEQRADLQKQLLSATQPENEESGMDLGLYSIQDALAAVAGDNNWGAIIQNISALSSKMIEAGKKIRESGKNDWGAYGEMAAASLAMVGTVLSQFASEEEADSKESFERKKKLQIGAAVMNMLGGITAAIASCWSPTNAWQTSPVQAVLAAVNAATVATIGGIQIAKIKQQQYGDTGGSTTADLNANAVQKTIIPPVQYSNAVQSASIEQAVGDTQSYVAVTEIERVANNVSVAETESRY